MVVVNVRLNSLRWYEKYTRKFYDDCITPACANMFGVIMPASLHAMTKQMFIDVARQQKANTELPLNQYSLNYRIVGWWTRQSNGRCIIFNIIRIISMIKILIKVPKYWNSKVKKHVKNWYQYNKKKVILAKISSKSQTNWRLGHYFQQWPTCQYSNSTSDGSE